MKYLIKAIPDWKRAGPQTIGESVVLVVSWFFRTSVWAWCESFPRDSRSTAFLTLYCWYGFTKVWQEGWRLCHWCSKRELIYFLRTKRNNVGNQSFGDLWQPTSIEWRKKNSQNIKSYRFWKGIMKILKLFVFVGRTVPLSVLALNSSPMSTEKKSMLSKNCVHLSPCNLPNMWNHRKRSYLTLFYI